MTYAECEHCRGTGYTGNPPGILETDARLDAVAFITLVLQKIADGTGPPSDDDFNAVFGDRLWCHFPEHITELATLAALGFLERGPATSDTLTWWADWAAAITAKNSPA